MNVPSLSRFSQSLRDYQQEVVSHALRYRDGAAGSRWLYSLPTGSGKGSIELSLLREWEDAWLVSPSLEVLRGFIERCGGPAATTPRAGEEIAADADALRISTPVRLSNRLVRGEIAPPATLIIDEGHHATDASNPIGALVAGATKVVGFTATPYRGSPRETQAFHDFWPAIFEGLSFPEAVERGVIALPEFRTVPLLEDSILGGGAEFNQGEADDLTIQFAAEIAQLACEQTRPTLVVVPGLLAAMQVTQNSGGRLRHVSGDTPTRERAEIYDACRQGKCHIVTVGVAVEGVDLPWLRVLIDARPTKSPVRWMQTLGRVTRPGDRPTYIGVTHNLERHAYVLQGAVPQPAITEAQTAWGPVPCLDAIGARAGIEVLGRYKPLALPLTTGAKASAYMLWSHDDDGRVREYVVVVSPYYDAFAAERVDRGAWRSVPVRDVSGWRSSRYRHTPASPKQQSWWSRCAGRFGLDSTAQVTGAHVSVFAAINALRRKVA